MTSPDLQNLYAEERRIELARQLYPTIKEWETRVVSIAPGEPSDWVVLSIHPAVILEQSAFGLPDEDRVQPYEALSYTWGAPVFSHPVVCNGVDFSVTQNLHAALVHLRYPDRERWVWIDALCINQYDLHEKARQVKALYRIFERAAKTLVWLGQAGLEATASAERMLEILRGREPPRYGYDTGYDTMQQFVGVHTDILGRAWFSRVWIIQEIAACQDRGKLEVHFGACIMS